jgi:hypothetical protein
MPFGFVHFGFLQPPSTAKSIVHKAKFQSGLEQYNIPITFCKGNPLKTGSPTFVEILCVYLYQ